MYHNLWLNLLRAKRRRRRHPRGAREKASSFCMYICDSSAMHKILKNGRRDLESKPIFLFLCPESISKVDQAGPWRSLTAHISDSIIIDTDVKLWHNLDSSFKIALLKFGIDIFYIVWKLCAFQHRWNFVQFPTVFFYHYMGNF